MAAVAKHKKGLNNISEKPTQSTVKPVLSGHLKIDKKKILITDSSLIKVESVAECFPWSILQYF